MNKQELLQLEKQATLKPADIRKKDAPLFEKLSEAASLELKTKVTAKLKQAPAELKAELKKVDFSASALGKDDVKAVLYQNLLAKNISAEKKQELETAVAKIPDLGKIDNVLLPDVPVFLNPLFQNDLQKAKLYRLNTIAGIADAKLDQVFDKKINLNNLNEEWLTTLVGDNTITRSEADRLGLASGLYHFVDGSFELAEEVSRQANLRNLADLAGVSKADWLKWIKNADMNLATGVKPEVYADFLAKKAGHLFPEISLAQKTTRVNPADLQKNIDALQPLLQKNNNLFGIQTFVECDPDQ